LKSGDGTSHTPPCNGALSSDIFMTCLQMTRPHVTHGMKVKEFSQRRVQPDDYFKTQDRNAIAQTVA